MPMEPGFVNSREFLVAAAVAALVVATGATVVALGLVEGGISIHGTGCDASAPPGDAVPVARLSDVTTGSPGSARREVRYQFERDALTGGDLFACTDTGGVTFGPSPDQRVHVTFRYYAEGGGAEEAVKELEVEARFAYADGHVGLLARQVTTRSAWDLFGPDTPEVSIEVLVPPEGVYAIVGVSDTGSVRVTDLRTEELTLHTDTGAVSATGIHASGDMVLTTDTGRVTLKVATLASGNATAHTDTGSVEVTLPADGRIGYDVTASTDTGNVQVDIGDTEDQDHHTDGASEHVHARSREYDDRRIQVTVVATSDTGSITVTTA